MFKVDIPDDMVVLLLIGLLMMHPSLEQEETLDYPVVTEHTVGENPTYPPHGCENYGLCIAPEEEYDYYGDLYYYICPLGECVCNNGTTGSTCRETDDMCRSSSCSTANGSMYSCTSFIGSFACVCQAGYTGASCETDINDPCGTKPCLSGGTCVSSNQVDYTCNCVTGYLGQRCQYNDPCINVTCVHGQCESILEGADFRCKCDADWQGNFCDEQKYLWSGAPVFEGCFKAYSIILDDPLLYKKFSDPTMTATKCKNILTAQSGPIYTMYTVSGTSCYLSNSNALNETRADVVCLTTCVGSTESCGVTDSRALVYLYDSVEYDVDACDNHALCNEDLGHGVCIDTATAEGGHICKCDPAYSGTECVTLKPGLCDSAPCSNGGTCTSDSVLGTYSCECTEGYCGEKCEFQLQCTSGLCLHGGTCVENYDGTYDCQCLQYYHGQSCEEIHTCEYANHCVNGTCESIVNGIVPGSYCICDPGYNGTYCDTEINECDSSPCKYGVCEDLHLDYNCTCDYGAEGKNCSIDIPDCVNYTLDGVIYENRCKTKDVGATCNEMIGGFYCTCSSQYTGEFCDLNIIIRDVMLTIYGEVNMEMLPMLEDLLRNPSQIKDMVPFIVGLQEYDNRTSLSWNYQDMFHWAAFEEKPLLSDRDLHSWNDVVLGNCFTFNHHSSEIAYKMRSMGIQGGLRTLMKVGAEEYVPWYETASVLVFVHSRDEYVFSESVRYNAQPSGETLISIRNTKYGRLAGKYGICVSDPSEVKAYYYEGIYTTDGCLRSCYQDMILQSCGCMDPRYPVAPNTSTCELVQRQCIDDAVQLQGDPSSWESCVCPLPCKNQQYSVEWHRTEFVSEPIQCLDLFDDSLDTCMQSEQDNVLITIHPPRLEYQVFEEVPEMDVNRFISNLGGLLGVLMGVCILSFIEVVVLVFRLVMILCSNKRP